MAVPTPTQELRQRCLELAVASRCLDEAPNQVVDRAQAYETYVTKEEVNDER